MSILILIFAAIGAFACYSMAPSRGKDPAVWAVLGFLLPLIAIIVLAVQPPQAAEPSE